MSESTTNLLPKQSQSVESDTETARNAACTAVAETVGGSWYDFAERAWDFAQRLERERDEARAEIARLRKELALSDDATTREWSRAEKLKRACHNLWMLAAVAKEDA